MHLHTNTLTIIGGVLLAGGLLLYLGAVTFAALRVRRQYSRAMVGGGGLYIGAALTAAVRYLPMLIVPLVGLVLLYASR